jgi:hypothetical protein
MDTNFSDNNQIKEMTEEHSIDKMHTLKEVDEEYNHRKSYLHSKTELPPITISHNDSKSDESIENYLNKENTPQDLMLLNKMRKSRNASPDLTPHSRTS